MRAALIDHWVSVALSLIVVLLIVRLWRCNARTQMLRRQNEDLQIHLRRMELALAMAAPATVPSMVITNAIEHAKPRRRPGAIPFGWIDRVQKKLGRASQQPFAEIPPRILRPVQEPRLAAQDPGVRAIASGPVAVTTGRVAIASPAPVAPEASRQAIAGSFSRPAVGRDQDRYSVQPLLVSGLPGMIMVVCDGVSSSSDGGQAATVAIDEFPKLIVSLMKKQKIRADAADAELEALVWEAAGLTHSKVRQLSRNPALRGAASTLDAVFLVPATDAMPARAAIAHIGDGTVWRLCRDGQAIPMTKPHVAATGAVVHLLGAKPNVEGDVVVARLTPGDRVMVCSDGLSQGLARRWGRDQIAFGLTRELHSYAGAAVQQIVDHLGEIAYDGQDDVTLTLSPRIQ